MNKSIVVASVALLLDEEEQNQKEKTNTHYLDKVVDAMQKN